MPTVSNTSPLIWLSKIGKLDLMNRLFGEVLIPEEVYREAVERGLKEGFSDALVIKEACNQGWLKVTALDGNDAAFLEKITHYGNELHEGEKHAIALAHRAGNNTLLLMDDSSGRAFAESWGLKVRGVLFVLMTAHRKGTLDQKETKRAVLNLVSGGFRIEPKLLARLIEEIDDK